MKEKRRTAIGWFYPYIIKIFRHIDRRAAWMSKVIIFFSPLLLRCACIYLHLTDNTPYSALKYSKLIRTEI